ncbi:MAG: lysophospholipid acyltransferase family protein [Actinomycetota bacterium]|nr:lysophospholipid acyltransferase family protein [Actinomycetota bacterium]MDD5668093.1 lysophospholipid acyltransferase family protein [Actinomycetota bacterium]
MEEGVQEKPKLLFRLLEGAFMAQFHVIKALSYILPPSVLCLIPKAMGIAFFYARPGMRRRLLQRITEAMPEISDPRELGRLGREVCVGVFMPLFDIFILARHGDRYMRELRLEGMDLLEEAEARGKGIIFTGAHTGAIGIIHAVMARLGKPYTPIAFNPKDTELPRYVETLEFCSGILGCDVEEPVFFVGEDIIPKVKEHLKAGKRIGLTFDIGGSGIVDFFGRPAALATGVAHFAYDSGAPVVLFSLRRGKGPFDNCLNVSGVVTCDPAADRRSEVSRVMQEVVKCGEEIIREIPGQWMSWFGLWSFWQGARDIMEGKAKQRG